MAAVARMPFLTMFNGSNVRLKERLEAEKSYVRRVMRELTTVGTSTNSSIIPRNACI